MKRKFVLRMGVVLLASSFTVAGAAANTDLIVKAEDVLSVDEDIPGTESENQDLAGLDNEEMPDIIVEDTESLDVSEIQDSQNMAEIAEAPSMVIGEETEVVLPQTSVVLPSSEFEPLKEQETIVSMNPYNGFYLLHLKSDSEKGAVISFNRELKEEEVNLYCFDSENHRVTDPESVQDVLSFHENNTVLSMDMKENSDYVLVISHAENYTELGYTARFTAAQGSDDSADVILITEEDSTLETEFVMESESEPETEVVIEPESESESETEGGTESESESEPETKIITETESESETEAVAETESETETEVVTETESESETEIITETESESETETVTETESELESESESETESGTETESESESESETEEAALASVKLNLDQSLGTVPVVFLDYLDNLDVYSVTLIYSDGSEKLLDTEDVRYELSVEQEDTKDTEETVRRTYHITVKEVSTGNIFEDRKEIVFGGKDSSEIKTEEMTTLALEGKKKWIVVQSTPEITGRYAFNSDKKIETIYYVSDGGEVVCTEDVLKLQQGVKYQFLIVLK
ncbi:MAG: hypothetical protein V8S12_04305 [Lachnospiraceae bacterium]